MGYEPAVNTTESTEKTKYWLDKAVAAAHREGVVILGFIVTRSGDTPIFEPFSSSQSMEPAEFVRLTALAAREMLTRDEPVN
jgi:hypothetical protein